MRMATRSRASSGPAGFGWRALMIGAASLVRTTGGINKCWNWARVAAHGTGMKDAGV